ncbi:MAG: AtpZ/AtpI family protein [Brumimicrobium sp.]|nr:AtpZ/AtpI family protein [Brumimicrobium sp.]MCO5267959.1 AtpZ/AtpI family protein [Brumimicrobium sp.]
MSETENKENKKRISNYLRFSNIAIQMGILITVAALGGRWLDEKQGNKTPVWTLVLTLLAIFGSLFQIIRLVIKIGKEDDSNTKK